MSMFLFALNFMFNLQKVMNIQLRMFADQNVLIRLVRHGHGINSRQKCIYSDSGVRCANTS